MQLASFGPDSAEAPEPEEPEDEKNATAEAERPVRVTESAAATPSNTNLPRNRTGFCRRSGFAARL